ncbi:MAG: Bug family tripartite tricarboxylate transporter substrate binding protein [Candidatus Binatia bacterium]
MAKIILIALLLIPWGLDPQAQIEPFYKAKTIRVVVGFSPGSIFDLWARATAQYWPKHIPGNPTLIVQNMPGAGSVVAANHVYGVAKPDGLTLGAVSSGIYIDQVVGRKEVHFDWAKFTWIGSPDQTNQILFVRADTAYKTLEDIRKATQPPRCGAMGTGTATYYIPKLLEDVLGLRFNVVTGYPGAPEIDLAIQQGEMHCRGGTVEAIFGRDPGRTWVKTGFVKVLVQSGANRDPRLPDTPTIWELMESEKTSEQSRRVVEVVLAPGSFGRPIVGPPDISSDRVKILRESYMKTISDPEFLAEAKKRGWEVRPTSGEILETQAKKVISQPPAVIERMKKILGG